jgi:FAD/FMN-containing dehydrogenase
VSLLITPDDPDWEAACLPWNAFAEQRPALVARPRNVDDVISVVNYARRNGLSIAVQATGHNAAAIPSLDGTILLSTRHMRGVMIDPLRCTAVVRAGTLAAELADAATLFGLYPLAGSSSDVGVVGHTLGGGVSWLGRKHGLAANHVKSIDVVTPDGEFVRATRTSHPDLFWALRGGGGNFGVVTAMEIGLFAHREIYAGMFLWPYERHAEVLQAWHRLTRAAPDELTTSLRIMHMPPLDDLPPFLKGRSVVVVDGAFAGNSAAGAAAVAELRRLAPEMDAWAPSSASELCRLHMDPEHPTPFASDSMVLRDLDTAAQRAFSASLPSGTPLLFGELRHLGGAIGRTPDGAGAIGALPGRYLQIGVGIVTRAGAHTAVEAALRVLRAAMSPYDTGWTYPNFTDRPVDLSTAYSADSYARLRATRAVVDPAELMVASHRISPRYRAA